MEYGSMHSGGGDAAAGLAVVLGAVCCGLIVALAIQAIICYLLAKLLQALPEEHRRQTPGMVWLLMIPIFGLIWNFFVFPKISESYKSYFAAQGRMEEANGTLALIYCILAACGIIPYLGALAGLGGLVVLIIYLVKMYDLKKQIAPMG